MTEKPLFIPLKTEWFEAFERGEKRSELRRYGPGWNERTCRPGRSVTLSCGYGKHRRMTATIAEFHRRQARTFGSTYRAAIEQTFGTLNIEIAEIRLTDLRPHEREQ